MEFNLTKSSITANGAQARINAVLVFASFGDRTVIVNQALVCKGNLCEDKSSQTYFFLSYYLLRNFRTMNVEFVIKGRLTFFASKPTQKTGL